MISDSIVCIALMPVMIHVAITGNMKTMNPPTIIRKLSLPDFNPKTIAQDSGNKYYNSEHDKEYR